MLLIFKIPAIVFSGGLTGVLIYLFINVLSLKIKNSMRLAANKVTEGAAGAQVSTKEYVKAALDILSEDPASNDSKKIIAMISFFVLIFAELVIGKFLFALLISLGSYWAVYSYFANKIKKKEGLFDNQLIEGLGMIANSVRAGQSLNQALENMVKDTKAPLSVEFEEALRQIKLGSPVKEALTAITERVKSKDLRIAVTSINLAKDAGGNLGEILTNLAGTMKERNKIRGKITAMTAQGKASGLVMGFMPFLLLAVLYLMEPDMMGLLFSTTLGNLMLFIAVGMVAAGMFVIKKIVEIDI